MQIIVRDNNIDQALKALKKKMQREGIFREMKLRGHYEKPSEKRARERGRGDPPLSQAAAQAPAARGPSAALSRVRETNWKKPPVPSGGFFVGKDIAS